MVSNLITLLEFGTLPLNDGWMAQATKKQPAHAGLLIFLLSGGKPLLAYICPSISL